MRTQFFQIVMITTQGFGLPHLEALEDANPGVRVDTHTLPDLDDHPRYDAWRNCDRVIRDWWRENRGAVQHDQVLFLEGDVFANDDLTRLLDGPWKDADMVAANCKYQVAHRRAWPGFKEIERLPEKMRDRAMGIEPLAVLLMSRKGLDLIADQRFDRVFDADIFCELRLPTVMRFAGGEVGFCPRMKTVGVTPCWPSFGESGIWHPVKEEVPQ